MTRLKRMVLASTAAAAVVLFATSDTRADAAAAKKEAQEVFTMRCTPCHGTTGAGDGPASASLTPKPRIFSDADWQKSVTDDHIEKIIKFGGAAVGKSPTMPGNPDLMAKNEVVAGIRAIIRGLKK